MTTQLLRSAKTGDRDALDELYRRIGPRLATLIRLRLDRRLVGILDIEDVVQEVLIQAFGAVEDLERDSSRSFFAWLAVIATHTMRDLASFHQQQKRDHRLTEVFEEKTDADRQARRGILTQLLVDEELQRLERALAGLSAEYREVIILRRFEERSFREIGAVSNCSEDASRMRYNRAMAALAERMNHDSG